jgi:hypothetical protein
MSRKLAAILEVIGKIKTVKVLQLFRSDSIRGGGGMIGMYRVHTGLRKAGIDSKILCQYKYTDAPDFQLLEH